MLQRLLWIAGVVGLVAVAVGLLGYPRIAALGAAVMVITVIIGPWMER
jgi:hypothetical protein